MLIFCQCANNGINYSKVQNGEKCNVDKLEMFFSGFPKIVGMNLFPSLTCLVIMSQPVSKIEGLSPLVLLRELWISECQLKVYIFRDLHKNIHESKFLLILMIYTLIYMRTDHACRESE